MTTFEIIKKNNKPFVRMINGDYVHEMKVYKANTNEPYVRYLGGIFYLTNELKEQL